MSPTQYLCSLHTCCVWVCMLVNKDQDGVIGYVICSVGTTIGQKPLGK